MGGRLEWRGRKRTGIGQEETERTGRNRKQDRREGRVRRSVVEEGWESDWMEEEEKDGNRKREVKKRKTGRVVEQRKERGSWGAMGDEWEGRGNRI